ncbi:3'(2'),5'-bisphosphate nucleotidase CysQ [Candidatus Peregrinibacteria bacterium]|nr:3'(2'),5'-bisphosphate nucleotidase CysQ [Candidatus Peregrinibacteria bacterium]
MDICATVLSVIKNAGDAVMEFYRYGNSKISNKNDGSPVTEADLVSQEIILKGLKQFGYPIVSEEQKDNDKRFSQDKVWFVDPLDGTKDFINRTGEFCVMIGLAENGEPILGVVYQPVKDIYYYARKGSGAYKRIGNGISVKLEVSLTSSPQKAKMFISRNHTLQSEIQLGKDIKIGEIIPCGSAGVKIGLIASGEGEVYVVMNGNTNEWDTCASDIIIQEAGGMMTDVQDKKLVYNKKSLKNKHGFVVTNKLLHKTVISALKNLR